MWLIILAIVLPLTLPLPLSPPLIALLPGFLMTIAIVIRNFMLKPLHAMGLLLNVKPIDLDAKDDVGHSHGGESESSDGHAHAE
mmetsp:Transcript_21118/g.54894  ORF Transcript_21118/g.54894 Transcript_21118/m.54894 type:complete len:84 (-) Transcript_21118:1687-1938(-)